ncbi:DUF4395 family protein [Mycolicibacterium sp. P9-22]|uniref:DUF4395 family protein n=1 Tax=Mycolicibacterium sp. P9-22 TaxID=2024613 RepID=UPI0011EF3766|nr:DUF4395 family protein [Mycolicibacterium sp. P9-22]KAA0118733.1 DUF4395 family protein [Mycolicibacterium sp. P9-22]
MTVNLTVRSRLEAQGFYGLDDKTLAELSPWMRWTYTLGTLVTLFGVVLTSPAVLWVLAAITSVGIFLPFHPFDLLYNYGMRFLTRTEPFPHSGPQRHFVFVVATVWLMTTGWAFYIGADIVGITLGVLLILVGGLASTTNFCIPSFIYNTVVDRRSAPAERSA